MVSLPTPHPSSFTLNRFGASVCWQTVQLLLGLKLSAKTLYIKHANQRVLQRHIQAFILTIHRSGNVSHSRHDFNTF